MADKNLSYADIRTLRDIVRERALTGQASLQDTIEAMHVLNSYDNPNWHNTRDEDW